jgi:hypothetical protein
MRVDLYYEGGSHSLLRDSSLLRGSRRHGKHTFANPGEEPAVILNTFTPDLYVQYFRDLRDMTADGQPPSAELITDLMSRYATEPATGWR